MIGTFAEILAKARNSVGRKRIVVALPERRHLETLEAAVREGLVDPLFVGDERSLGDLRLYPSLAETGGRIFREPGPGEALKKAIGLVRSHEADILLQGGTPQQAFVDAVCDARSGLMNSRLLSHVSLFERSGEGRLILVTDTYIQNHPSLTDKQSILENVIKLAALLEIPRPKVAVLAAIEQVNPGIPSTLDAAILSKMAERRQFGNIILEGPLDIDCALDRKAADRKGVKSEVTGNVDIYLVPEIDTGYSMAQMLFYIGNMRMAGVLLGSVSPVVLDLPFVAPANKVVEIALAVLAAGWGAGPD